MGSDSLKPTRCYICEKESCKGDCKKCLKRLAGECKEFYIYHTYRDSKRNIVWYGVCRECDKPFASVPDGTEEHLEN